MPTTARRRSTTNWPRIIGALVPISVAILGWFTPLGKIIIDLFAATGTPVPTAVVASVVRITSISDGEIIRSQAQSVTGTYDHVPDDKQLWLVVVRGSTCFPQDGPAILDQTGTWRHGPINFYASGSYQISTVLADANISALLRSGVGSKLGMPCSNAKEIISTISVEVQPSAVIPTDIPLSALTETPLAPKETETPSGPSVKILGLGPEVGEDVPLVKGTYSNIPADRQLWLVIFIGSNFFPQDGPAVLLPDRTWNYGTIHFGGPGDFIVYAVLADVEASSLFRQSVKQLKSMPQLPAGAEVYDAVNATRKK